MTVIRLLSTSFVLLLGAACMRDDGRLPRIPLADREMADILNSAEEWTLYALDPSRLGEGRSYDETFHHHGVLGQAPLSDPEAKRQLAKALRSGIRGNNTDVAACFIPRHGISAATEQGQVDLVICFQCLQIEVYDGDGTERESELTTSDPRAVFDAIYSAQGLQIAQ